MVTKNLENFNLSMEWPMSQLNRPASKADPVSKFRGGGNFSNIWESSLIADSLL